jgi:large subunit ribosomal protein L54
MGSIPGGTPLYGLGYLKSKPTVLAKEDDEYPDWLWTLLDPAPGTVSKDGKSAADLAGKLSHHNSSVLLHDLCN